MGRKLLMLWLLGGVFFGYGSAVAELVHGSDGGHCSKGRWHHDDRGEPEAP